MKKRIETKNRFEEIDDILDCLISTEDGLIYYRTLFKKGFSSRRKQFFDALQAHLNDCVDVAALGYEGCDAECKSIMRLLFKILDRRLKYSFLNLNNKVDALKKYPDILDKAYYHGKF